MIGKINRIFHENRLLYTLLAAELSEEEKATLCILSYAPGAKRIIGED